MQIPTANNAFNTDVQKAPLRSVFARRLTRALYDYTLHETPEMFYVVGRERGHFKSAGESLALAIRTSRIFRRTQDGWRQVHHHGSIDDPGLLARYQQVVLGR